MHFDILGGYLILLFGLSNGGDGNGTILLKCLGRVVDTGEDSVVVPGFFTQSHGDTVFRLERRELNCKRGRFKVIFDVAHNTSTLLRYDYKVKHKTVVNEIVTIHPDGYLSVLDQAFHPNEYCVDQIDRFELSVFVCDAECSGPNPCVPKCCGVHQVFNVTLNQCVNSNKTYSPELFSWGVDNCVKRISPFHRNQISVHYSLGVPHCDYVVIPLRKIHNVGVQRFRVLWNGSVILRGKYGNWSAFPFGEFCVDGFVDGDHPFDGGFHNQVVVACANSTFQFIQKKPIPVRYAVMLLASAGILLLTIVISALLWDTQNVYDWTVFCQIFAMFFLILLVGVAHTVARKPEKSDFGSPHCVFIGAAAHFFWLATFGWLFIINFEIWWNFRSLVQLRASTKWHRFMVYQFVGWGIPGVVVFVGLLLDKFLGLQNENLDCSNMVVPNYGQTNCYVSKAAQGAYIFYPVGAILGVNLLFYTLTVLKMYSYQKKTNAVITHRSRSMTQPVLIFAKLFIVMGVSWIFEIVSWGVTSSEPDKIPLYWVIFDIVTLFQAISIFVLFVWKKTVLSSLYHKFTVLRGCLGVLARLPGCGILPNERDRLASLQQTPQKLVRHDVQVSTNI